MDENIKEKKNKGLIIFIVILLIIFTGMTTFVFINKDKLTTKESEKITKKNSKEEKAKNQKEQNTTAEVETEEEEEETEEVKDLDLSKALNTNGYTYSDVTSQNQDVGFSLKINDDKQSVTVTIYEAGSKLISNVIHSTWTADPVNKQITGFNKKIKSTYIGGLGQDSVGTIFFFIMEDGTITYTKLFEKALNADGTMYYDTKILDNAMSINTVDNVDGIIKLYGANANAPMSTGAYTILAAKKDGSFYDLGQIIK